MKQQILIIDDSKPIHALVSTILAEEPVQIHSAFDATFGLTLAASLRPDLILLDVEMPGIDGYETCRRLKSNPDLFNTPVIFLTAMAATEEKIRGLELGAVDYVTKPFNPSELLARVRASLRTGQLIRILEDKALVDFLTGLGNKAMFKQRLAAEVALRIRTNKPLAVIAVDVDNFQAINDAYGHPVGDRVLQAVATAITDVSRVEDVACRLGGDAFAILTPNTETPEATGLANRLKSALAVMAVTSRGKKIEIKCSVAVAPAIEPFDRSMVDRANDSIAQARQRAHADAANIATQTPAAA
jgi:diguanylate cyclase (GGDEF)-like protein